MMMDAHIVSQMTKDMYIVTQFEKSKIETFLD